MTRQNKRSGISATKLMAELQGDPEHQRMVQTAKAERLERDDYVATLLKGSQIIEPSVLTIHPKDAVALDRLLSGETREWSAFRRTAVRISYGSTPRHCSAGSRATRPAMIDQSLASGRPLPTSCST